MYILSKYKQDDPSCSVFFCALIHIKAVGHSSTDMEELLTYQ